MEKQIEIKPYAENYDEVWLNGKPVAQIEKGNIQMYEHVMKEVLCDHDAELSYGCVFGGDTEIICTKCGKCLYWVTNDLRAAYKVGYKENGIFVTKKDDPRLEGLVFN